jgi:hypothetical protein
MKLNEIRLDLPLNETEVDSLIQERTSGQVIRPEFVELHHVRKPEAYNRFREVAKKEQFKERLTYELYQWFVNKFGEEHAEKRIVQFKNLAKNIEANGAISFGNMIDYEAFAQLITQYDKNISIDGSQSWIHSYINIGNYPDFLTHPQFHHAFLHPLLIALISYCAGGPIRIVDARGKDAEPLTVQAQDNMLHIDNTPFRQEFKVILTWERGKVSGPKGQNFVLIPGTHKGVRNCKVTEKGDAWSTEDGSIFTTEEAIDSIFALQEKIMPGQSPSVVEVTHPDMPLTTVFRAGELIHHRYRTKEKNVPRSCIILAFHRAEDNPGQFLEKEKLSGLIAEEDLLALMIGHANRLTYDSFLNALMAHAENIAEKLDQIAEHQPGKTETLSYEQRKLGSEELAKWKKIATDAPTVEAIKMQSGVIQLKGMLTQDILLEMIKYDKHGPLDLILYEDGHEEIRKWARNRIREMPLSRLSDRIKTWDHWELFGTPLKSDLLQPGALSNIATQLIQWIDKLSVDEKANGFLGPQEKIASQDAFRSLRQLIADLGEAIERCASRQTFLSTSLFLFMACDELHYLLIGAEGQPLQELTKLSKDLAANYLASYILIEKQISLEQRNVTQTKAHAPYRYQFYSTVSGIPTAKTPENPLQSCPSKTC